MPNLRIAAAMLQTPVGRVAENLEAVVVWTRRARQAGARLVCFPEMTLTGYSTRRSLVRHALTLEHPAVARLRELAQKEVITILVGAAEAAPGGRLYAAHWVVQPGRPIGVYRKTHIAPPEKRYLTPGNDAPVFDVGAHRIGIQLCYDAHFPELSAHMASRGADILFFPHASPRGTPEEKCTSWRRHLTARAFDNSVFVVACNQAGANGEGLSFPPTALMIGPSGDLLAQDIAGQEGLLVADLETSLLTRVRGHRMRYFFPNRRPDLYRRLLDTQTGTLSEPDLT